MAAPERLPAPGAGPVPGGPVEFYAGQVQDGLALDPLTAYSTVLVPFFAGHPYARLSVLTKSTDVAHLLPLHHAGHTTLGWTLNPPEVARRFEPTAPPPGERLVAMRRCHEAGYPVQANVMPVISHGDWEREYMELVGELLESVPLAGLTLGGISMDSRTRELLERRLGPGNAISRHLGRRHPNKDDRMYYSCDVCQGLFGRIRGLARRIRPGLPVEVAIP